MINGYVLLAALTQFISFGFTLLGAFLRSKYVFVVALGVSVPLLGISLKAVRGQTGMSAEYLGWYTLVGGIVAAFVLALIAAIARSKAAPRKKGVRPDAASARTTRHEGV